MQIEKNLDLTVPKDLPRPTGYRMILVMPQIKAQTSGGIYLPDERQREEMIAGMVGYVAAQGEDCYSSDEFHSRWCEVGDWVVIAKYAGAKLKIDGVECRIVNDNGILATVDDPQAVQRGEL